MTQLDRLVELMADGIVWTMKALAEEGFTTEAVSRALRSGAVERLSRGIYRHAKRSLPGHSEFAIVSARCPTGVVCLLSAACYHRFGDVSSDEIWLAIQNSARPPKMDWPKIRPVRWRRSEALTLGVETAMIAGVPVRITNPARTVVDLLRMIPTVGEERALKAVRDYLRQGGSLNEVRSIAEKFGVKRVLSAYV